jgi:hypothetical protein
VYTARPLLPEQLVRIAAEYSHAGVGVRDIGVAFTEVRVLTYNVADANGEWTSKARILR